MRSRLLNDLDYRFKNVAFQFLARMVEDGIQVMIVGVLGTEQDQAELVARGVSWTMKSKHMPQPPDGKSLAIDICPFDQYQLHGPDKLQWDETDPVWQRIGKIGQGLGLKWGVVTSDGRRKDLGHFEWVEFSQRPNNDKIA